MLNAIIPTSTVLLPQPLPQVNVTIRPGVMGDVAFLDSLQKLHTKEVGWMPTKQFEGKIKLGHVLVAEMDGSPVGYCIGNDQYFKRDDVGIIYQMNVSPLRQRGLIGASLLKAQFERSAYGCRLYCCWCAQDIEANRFWEAMGFVPLAFRAGSEKRSRVHIFWQKRIRAGDTTTPWWFPSKTAGGSIREDRIVLPIPPGTHWSDAKPMILPEERREPALPSALRLRLEESGAVGLIEASEVSKKPPCVRNRKSTIDNRKSEAPIRRNGLMWDIPRQDEPLPEEKPVRTSKPKTPKVKRTCDPRLVNAARELRDRWLEQVNASAIHPVAKYEVTRVIEERPGATPLLAA